MLLGCFGKRAYVCGRGEAEVEVEVEGEGGCRDVLEGHVASCWVAVLLKGARGVESESEHEAGGEKNSAFCMTLVGHI